MAIAGAPKTEGAGVVANFEGLGSSPIRESLIEQIAHPQPVQLDLNEVTCIAATNDRMAQAIENERRAILCRTEASGSSDCRVSTALDTWLAGQANEQRNRAAADAAEVFLRLAEAELQRELLLESAEEIMSREKALDRAAESGFATAEARQELEQIKLELEHRNSELTTNRQRLQFQLNLLLGGKADEPILVAPVFELTPAQPTFDVRAEMAAAASQRPGIVAAERALNSGASPKDLAAWLGAFDRRLGIRPVQQLTTRWLARQATDVSQDGEIRMEQARLTLESLRDQARAEAAQAMLDADAAWDTVDLIATELTQLETRQKQLKRLQEVTRESQAAELAQIRIAIRKARSRQISAAIDLEIARIHLLAAQGRLSDCAAGFDPQTDSAAPVPGN